MTEVMQTMLSWLSQMMHAFLTHGSYIGLFIVFSPLFLLVVRALRSIISKKG